MSTVLDQTTALSELAELWEEHADAQVRYDPQDPKAKTLARCAADLRKILGDHTPEWVSIGMVAKTTGRSLSTLRRRCPELAAEGRARKRGGRWEIALEAALELPRVGTSVDLNDAEDLDSLARLLGQDRG